MGMVSAEGFEELEEQEWGGCELVCGTPDTQGVAPEGPSTF